MNSSTMQPVSDISCVHRITAKSRSLADFSRLKGRHPDTRHVDILADGKECIFPPAQERVQLISAAAKCYVRLLD